METRIATIGIIVEKKDDISALNSLLSEYGQYIIGRMGLPYHKHDIRIINIAINAPENTINALSGKIGKLNGISVKTTYSQKKYNESTD